MDPVVLALMQLVTWVGAPFVGKAVEAAGTQVGEYFGGRVANVLTRVFERTPDSEEPDQKTIRQVVEELEIGPQIEQKVVDGLKKIVCDGRLMWSAQDFDALYYRLGIDRVIGPPNAARPYSELPDLCSKGRWLVDWAVSRGIFYVVMEWLAQQRPNLFKV